METHEVCLNPGVRNDAIKSLQNSQCSHLEDVKETQSTILKTNKLKIKRKESSVACLFYLAVSQDGQRADEREFLFKKLLVIK